MVFHLWHELADQRNLDNNHTTLKNAVATQVISCSDGLYDRTCQLLGT